MKNPIKNNRIISDYTFAIRLLNYLALDYQEIGKAHQIIEEDYKYLVRTTCNLVIYQFETCPNNEQWYFENLVQKKCNSGKEIIENFFNEDFVKYLKNIKAI